MNTLEPVCFELHNIPIIRIDTGGDGIQPVESSSVLETINILLSLLS